MFVPAVRADARPDNVAWHKLPACGRPTGSIESRASLIMGSRMNVREVDVGQIAAAGFLILVVVALVVTNL